MKRKEGRKVKTKMRRKTGGEGDKKVGSLNRAAAVCSTLRQEMLNLALSLSSDQDRPAPKMKWKLNESVLMCLERRNEKKDKRGCRTLNTPTESQYVRKNSLHLVFSSSRRSPSVSHLPFLAPWKTHFWGFINKYYLTTRLMFLYFPGERRVIQLMRHIRTRSQIKQNSTVSHVDDRFLTPECFFYKMSNKLQKRRICEDIDFW